MTQLTTDRLSVHTLHRIGRCAREQLVYPSATLQRLARLILYVLFGLAIGGCTQLAEPDVPARRLDLVSSTESDSTPLTAATPNPAPRIEIPVTVEVTRIITQPIMVPATPAPPAPCAGATYTADNTLIIGALLPLSGSSSFSAGFSMQTALNLAVETLRAADTLAGTHIELITYDTAGDPARAEAFAHRLITLDCAAALVGGFHGPVALTTAAVAERYQVPYLVLHAAADDITANGYSAVFRIAPTLTMYAQMPAALVSTLNTQRAEASTPDKTEPIDDVLIIGDPDTLSPALLKDILAGLEQNGVYGELLPVDLPSQDFSSTVARILSRAQLPQLIFILVHGDAALNLQSQLLRAGIGPEHDVQLVTSFPPARATDFWHALPQGAGTLFSHFGPLPDPEHLTRNQFLSQYAPYAEGWPPAYVFAAYDAVSLIFHSVESAQSAQGEELLTALAQVNLELSGGRYYFDYTHLHTAQNELDAAWQWQQWPAPPLYYLRATMPNQPLDDMEIVWTLSPAGSTPGDDE